MVATNSETQIVNSALMKIGEKTIVDLDDGSNQARHMKRQYDISRNQLLRSYRWNFAIKRAALAALATSPAFGFEYEATLPDDCLLLIGVFEEEEPQENYTSSMIPHKVEGRKVLSDENPLNVFYIAEITDPNQFDPLFSEALSWLLAINLAYFFTASANVVKMAQENYQEALRVAKRNNAYEGTPEVIVSSDWLDARSAHQNRFRPGPINHF